MGQRAKEEVPDQDDSDAEPPPTEMEKYQNELAAVKARNAKLSLKEHELFKANSPRLGKLLFERDPDPFAKKKLIVTGNDHSESDWPSFISHKYG